jgi:hypothetical protein
VLTNISPLAFIQRRDDYYQKISFRWVDPNFPKR